MRFRIQALTNHISVLCSYIKPFGNPTFLWIIMVNGKSLLIACFKTCGHTRKVQSEKRSKTAYLRASCHLFYVQHQTPYPPPWTYVTQLMWSQMLSVCGNSRPRVAHILNGCPVALEQGRYTWRHDCVLSTITSALRYHISAETNNICRPPQFRSIPLAQFPHSFLVTPLKPDLVLLHKGDYQATVIELTCSTNT